MTRQYHGFTLLELLVVLFIVALMSGLVALALPSGNTQAIEREAQRLQAHLNLARSYAQGAGVALEFRVITKTWQSEGGYEFFPVIGSNKIYSNNPRENTNFNLSSPRQGGVTGALRLPPELMGLKVWQSPEVTVIPTKLRISPEPIASMQKLTLKLGVENVQTVSIDIR